MITNNNSSDRQRCVQYWPDADSPENKAGKQFGSFSVRVIDTPATSVGFDVRRLTLTNDKTRESRQVTQYHYLAWPDHGVPLSSGPLLTLRARALSADTPSPVLVHCSAGVGRTGTLILLDLLMQAGSRDRELNVVKALADIRQQRMHSIQSIEQFSFLYDTLFEHFVCGETDIATHKFVSYRKKAAASSGPGSLKAQFEVLNMLRPTIYPHAQEVARRSVNMSKNRDQRILPPDVCRPNLITDVSGRDEYINAVCVPMYGRNEPYLVTQMPLTDTQVDLWRMMYDYGVGTIIMLNELATTDKPYWPENHGSRHFGPITVRHVETKPGEGVTWRELKVTNRNHNTSAALVVRQFCLNLWPPGELLPQSIAATRELLDEVTRWQSQSGDRPIVMHCMDGAERSGMMLALWSAIERLRLEHHVDVYRAARGVLYPRPQFLSHFEQYEFMYEVIADYLDRYKTYANFQ